MQHEWRRTVLKVAVYPAVLLFPLLVHAQTYKRPADCDSPVGRERLAASLRADPDVEFQRLAQNNRPDAEQIDREGFISRGVVEACMDPGQAPGWSFNVDATSTTFRFNPEGKPNRFICSTSNPDRDCNTTIALHLPHGWQVCRLRYDPPQEVRRGRVTFTPSDWFVGDVESPDRFGGYLLKLTGHGDPGNGSSAMVENVLIDAIWADLPNSERFKRRCEMPDNDARIAPATSSVRAPPSTPAPPLMPANFRAELIQMGENAELVISNLGGTAGVAHFTIYVESGGQWISWAYGDVTVAARSSVSQPVHKIGATKWMYQLTP